MTWKEVLDSNKDSVIVESYGYTEKGIFSSHFEPFSKKRKFKFDILKWENGAGLIHDWLFLEDLEDDLFFEERDGVIYLDDPDLWARS